MQGQPPKGGSGTVPSSKFGPRMRLEESVEADLITSATKCVLELPSDSKTRIAAAAYLEAMFAAATPHLKVGSEEETKEPS